MSDVEHVRTQSTTFLVGLEARLQRSITELQDYRRNVLTVLRERQQPDHPLHDLPDVGDNPQKRAAQTSEYLT